MGRTRIHWFLFAQLVVALAAGPYFWSTAPALAKTDSFIIIDAGTGKVLSEHNADVQTYPASLTKMMTLYLMFEALEQGKIKLDQRFTVSHHAAQQAPSKLGLVEGETISVRDLILGMVTKSANDAAVVAAEGLAGSESAFAERMTEKARALGMMHTQYRDASGLPNPGQLTTARDLAKLARALYRDFPKEYGYFATDEFTFNGLTYANHNHLMQHFEGMDGIKTGYIRASGFNLAASAVRDNRRLIGVVMGGQSPRSRDTEMARLLNTAFSGKSHAPDVMTADNDDDQDSSTLTHRAARTIAALSPVGRAEAATPANAHAARHAKGDRQERWSIQVGAFAQESGAERAGATALAKLPSLKSKVLQVVAPGHTDKERYYRARIVSFSQRDAEKACRALHRRHLQCAVVGPSAPQSVSASAGSRG